MPIPHLPFLPQSYRRDLATQIPRSSRHFGLLPRRAYCDSKAGDSQNVYLQSRTTWKRSFRLSWFV
jgi:hypothetical protein